MANFGLWRTSSGEHVTVLDARDAINAVSSRSPLILPSMVWVLHRLVPFALHIALHHVFSCMLAVGPIHCEVWTSTVVVLRSQKILLSTVGFVDSKERSELL